jgi:hypothetical protein
MSRDDGDFPIPPGTPLASGAKPGFTASAMAHWQGLDFKREVGNLPPKFLGASYQDRTGCRPFRVVSAPWAKTHPADAALGLSLRTISESRLGCQERS